MIIDVQYNDFSYDYVSTQTLDKLLSSKKIRRFFRSSEKRWVDVYHDPIRGSGCDYSGPNRRQRDMTK